jgi:hypothetical protein
VSESLSEPTSTRESRKRTTRTLTAVRNAISGTRLLDRDGVGVSGWGSRGKRMPF